MQSSRSSKRFLGFNMFQHVSTCFNMFQGMNCHFFVKILAGAIVWCLRKKTSPRFAEMKNQQLTSEQVDLLGGSAKTGQGWNFCTSDCWFLSLMSLIFVWFKTDSTISSIVSLIIIDTWFCREFLICIGCNNACHGPWFSEGQSDEWRIRGFYSSEHWMDGFMENPIYKWMIKNWGIPMTERKPPWFKG